MFGKAVDKVIEWNETEVENTMSSTIGGNDPLHQLPDEVKQREEKRIRKEARDKYADDPKRRKKEDNRATEISRRKSRRAHE